MLRAFASSRFVLFSLTSAALMTLGTGEDCSAQGRSKPQPAAGGKALDQQAEKVMTDYLSGLADLATRYEETGDREKAVEMLKSILKVKPDAEIVKSRIKSLEEQVFNDNVITLDLDPSAGWVMAGVLVQKDKPVRIEADGTFKVTLSETISAAGFATQDPVRDLVDNVPTGALMAIVAKGETGNRRAQPTREKDSPKPVTIGNRKEFNPPESGALFLKINLPESARASGKIKLKITGNMMPIR